MSASATPWETMIVASSRQLAGERVCFVGIGPPNLACGLAKRTVAPELVLIYEAGVVGARPARQPLSIGDPTLVTGALSVTPMFDLFALYLQRGLVDVAFLGASQIDRRGNINTTVIGDYQQPAVRLPGSGGACEIALNAGKVFVIMQQSKRSFVERVDFVPVGQCLVAEQFPRNGCHCSQVNDDSRWANQRQLLRRGNEGTRHALYLFVGQHSWTLCKEPKSGA